MDIKNAYARSKDMDGGLNSSIRRTPVEGTDKAILSGEYTANGRVDKIADNTVALFSKFLDKATDGRTCMVKRFVNHEQNEGLVPPPGWVPFAGVIKPYSQQYEVLAQKCVDSRQVQEFEKKWPCDNAYHVGPVWEITSCWVGGCPKVILDTALAGSK